MVFINAVFFLLLLLSLAGRKELRQEPVFSPFRFTVRFPFAPRRSRKTLKIDQQSLGGKLFNLLISCQKQIFPQALRRLQDGAACELRQTKFSLGSKIKTCGNKNRDELDANQEASQGGLQI